MRGAQGKAAQLGFRVEYGNGQVDALVKSATAANIGVAFAPRSPDRTGLSTAIGIVIAAVAIGLFLFVAIGRQGGGAAGSTQISTSSGRGKRTTFADVAGNAAAITDLHEVVSFLREPKRFAGMGARVPKGILLEGPPGTGKTLMARALAGEAGTNFFAMSGPDFSAMFLGVGAMRVKSLFRRARKAGGGVIFIDEIDSLGGKRGRQNGHQEDDRTLNQFLVELDGFDPTAGVVVVAATNRAADLDPALLRKGRFDRAVTISLPSVDERAAILRLHAAKRNMPLSTDVDLERLARLMPGTSGADLEGLLNEAAIIAVRAATTSVTWAHMEEARDRVLLGRAREGFTVTNVERRLVALHEAGHAIAGLVYAPSDPLHKVTIQPRGAAMGVAFFQPDHETHLHSRAYLEGQIRKGLGGRAAEEIIYGEAMITSGAASDLQHVTRIAKQMVYRLGMGERTGLVTWDPDSGPVSGEMHARMDADVRSILELAYGEVRELLRNRREELEALGDALLERETLTGIEAVDVMAAASAVAASRP
jgi:cell division protease FtsH